MSCQKQDDLKRLFDFTFSLIALFLLLPVIVILLIIATVDTKQPGLFIQDRVGRYGRIFRILKIRTMKNENNEAVATRFGKFLRRSKADELPQLWNVLTGEMSVVGPRPDVQGYYDTLDGEARKILLLRPGLTGPASLKYLDEEELLLRQKYPEEYNKEVIFPDKVKINLAYYYKQSLLLDLKIIFNTLLRRRLKEEEIFN